MHFFGIQRKKTLSSNLGLRFVSNTTTKTETKSSLSKTSRPSRHQLQLRQNTKKGLSSPRGKSATFFLRPTTKLNKEVKVKPLFDELNGCFEDDIVNYIPKYINVKKYVQPKRLSHKLNLLNADEVEKQLGYEYDEKAIEEAEAMLENSESIPKGEEQVFLEKLDTRIKKLEESDANFQSSRLCMDFELELKERLGELEKQYQKRKPFTKLDMEEYKKEHAKLYYKIEHKYAQFSNHVRYHPLYIFPAKKLLGSLNYKGDERTKFWLNCSMINWKLIRAAVLHEKYSEIYSYSPITPDDTIKERILKSNLYNSIVKKKIMEKDFPKFSLIPPDAAVK